jgi:hypothetical protein
MKTASRALLLLGSVGLASFAQNGAALGDARAVLEKWVETKRVLSKEQQDWVVGREMLNERIALVQGEIDALRTKMREAETTIAEADLKRDELIAEHDRKQRTAAALAGTVVGLEGRMRGLLQRLPDPILERVKTLSQRIPDGETKQTLGERFMSLVGILNEVDKFNREITVTSEVRMLGEGTSDEVAALYVGVGQGYYVNARGDAAGIGSATSEGWVWRPANDAAAQVAQAIAILKNEAGAAFVPLPVRIE